MALTIYGIYDLQTFLNLKQRGVKSFCFDFRPTSLNFIQEHVLHSILTQESSSTFEYNLLFDRDPHFVIEKIVTDLLKKQTDIHSKNLLIHFEKEVPFELVEKLGVGFKCYYSNAIKVDEYIRHPLFRGFIFPYEILEELAHSSQLFPLFKHLTEEFKKYSYDHILYDVVFKNQTKHNSLFDFFPFSKAIYCMNPEVETSYRNVDTALLNYHLDHLQKTFNL